MNIIERQKARSLMKQAEMAKDPFLARQLKRMQSRAAEEQKRMEVLDSWGSNGYVPPKQQSHELQKSDEELRIDAILEHYN